MNGNCDHCKEPLNNRAVVMGDGGILCYTCGRLRAEMSLTLRGMTPFDSFTLKCSELEKRER